MDLAGGKLLRAWQKMPDFQNSAFFWVGKAW
jgi:hypothetical protein